MWGNRPEASRYAVLGPRLLGASLAIAPTLVVLWQMRFASSAGGPGEGLEFVLLAVAVVLGVGVGLFVWAVTAFIAAHAPFAGELALATALAWPVAAVVWAWASARQPLVATAVWRSEEESLEWALPPSAACRPEADSGIILGFGVGPTGEGWRLFPNAAVTLDGAPAVWGSEIEGHNAAIGIALPEALRCRTVRVRITGTGPGRGTAAPGDRFLFVYDRGGHLRRVAADVAQP